MTVLELSVVVAILLFLVTILMFGVRAWRRGVDRTTCILNIRTVQNCVRAYQNLYAYNPGTMPYAENGTQSIIDHLHHKGYISESMHEAIKVRGECPGGGHYTMPQEEVFPAMGTLYLRCSLENTERHKMPGTAQW